MRANVTITFFQKTKMENGKNPLCILLFSGKRKCGKDYFTDKLFERCGSEDLVIIKISRPIKFHFAKTFNLDLEELMGDGDYKEQYREKMIVWGNEIRKKDPGVFCRSAIDMYGAYSKKVWIVSDVRRKSDIKWFKENFGDIVKTIRIEARCDVRESRGWSFVAGVDDVSSECDLDDYEGWDWKFENNGEEEIFKEALNKICDHLKHIVWLFMNFKNQSVHCACGPYLGLPSWPNDVKCSRDSAVYFLAS